MKRYFFLIGLGLIYVGGFSQETQTLYSPINNMFFEDLLKEMSENPANYEYVPIGNYTASNLFYRYETGSLKQGGIPESIQRFGIETKGIYRDSANRLFFGDLSIEKSYYDDLKWNLSYQLPENGLMSDPHYFGVSKGAKWNNQDFDISGGMIQPLGKKWSFLIKANYHLFNKYRTDFDPRPKITFNDLEFLGGFSYLINNKHHIKLNGVYGSTDVSNDVDFSNNDKNIPYNYDIYIKWIAGYGSLVSPFKSNTQRKFTQTGYNLGYSYISEKNKFFADFSYREKEQITYRSASVENEDDPAEYFATYSPQTMDFSLIGLHTINERNLLKLSMNTHIFSGDNFITSKGGKSYSAEEKNINFNLALLNQDSNGITNIDTGIKGEWLQVKQQDILAATISDITNLNLGAYFLKSYKVKENLRINPFGEISFSYNYSSDFINGSQDYLSNISENDYAGLALKAFYDEVIYPDVELLSTNRINISTGVSVNFLSAGNLNSLFRLEAGIKKPLEELDNFEESKPHRLYGSTSLTIYY